MAGKSRVPMQVSPIFEFRIKDLQSKIMKKSGKNISLRDLTEQVVKVASFEEVERSILNVGINDFSIKFDRRRR